MKNFVSSLLVTLLAISSYSQSNLQFSRVILTQGDTVPQGKTWKIESLIYNRAPISLSSGTDTQEDKILINNVQHVLRKSAKDYNFTTLGNGNSQSAMSYIWENNFPIWLPGGTIVQSGEGVAYISAIEFLIAP